MEFLVPLLASVVLLFVSGVLLSTLGRRRRRRARPLAESQRLALEGMLGEGLAALVAGSVQLRQEIEELARRGTEMLAVEHHLSHAARRPLWRQIEEAHYGQELGELSRATKTWLAIVDGLPTVERQVLDSLGLELDAVRVLDVALRSLRSEGGAGLDALRSLDDDVRAVERELDAAVRCLQHLERELSAYRGGGYR